MNDGNENQAPDRQAEAVEFSKEYWEHRKHYYRNRRPVDVELARAALDAKP